ncbi:hypothetical protein PHYBLDRAFT_148265 [Phycomyces blakesleeanus NRRL 1555(-)]|uniref:DUF4218 domain-containing protein n=1 Tax=Phycomyces blakesleeanus (strain ATCC 8743b / DSM 1359 / FGSC 10004 / NBRC 33097 / NRRL 1555) TaxID=763407 RepID=A0A167LT72_PHYB8|nr:hypothetical protein PHYBLDRAFT_148265 [Phycomyces blakesleeanus NRRL 1555(-)]OAD71046.1 hypothetical protein PHYBLDRAFT_148265 [Phycomyces blakesleeanus NRRL 1555(-)]|eukprot:XP_018289086.1 hypothetical protein PHYBLDRAFT_148265 [Phycomyces blakesleeanus NRRL 1555(-)]
MNIDWFQPFDGVTYSCGVIYLCINNLPRSEWYKKENVVLVGLMPGSKEAKTSEINHYLRPLVTELNQLYGSVVMSTVQCLSGALVHAALLLVACNIPAAYSNAVDYSGFVFSEWVPHTDAENCRDAELWRMASKLHDLIYFNLVECTVIDPMHNLYLGTAKRIMEKWRSSGLITDAHLAEMQLDADKLVLPEDYMPLGTKIGCGFPFMKADEWKSWCLVYSPVILHGRLPEAHLGNWTTFVNACQYLSMPSISMAHLDEAHQSLEAFCRECEKLYKAPFLSPNMHLHLHLRETVLNFGPVYGYWLFSFERCNATSTSTDTSIQFNINAFLDSPEINFDIVKGNKPLPPSALPLALKGEISMDESEYEHLLEYYHKTYNDQTLVHYCQAGHSNNFVNNRIQKFESINLLGQIYKSKTKNQHGSFMQALFETSDGRSTKSYAGQIQYLFVNTAEVLLQPRAGEGVEVNEVGFEDDSMNSILPVHRICYPVAVGKHLGLEGKVQMCVVPLPRKIYI